MRLLTKSMEGARKQTSARLLPHGVPLNRGLQDSLCENPRALYRRAVNHEFRRVILMRDKAECHWPALLDNSALETGSSKKRYFRVLVSAQGIRLPC